VILVCSGVSGYVLRLLSIIPVILFSAPIRAVAAVTVSVVFHQRRDGICASGNNTRKMWLGRSRPRHLETTDRTMKTRWGSQVGIMRFRLSGYKTPVYYRTRVREAKVSVIETMFPDLRERKEYFLSCLNFTVADGKSDA
jgi:hypothetical protein